MAHGGLWCPTVTVQINDVSSWDNPRETDLLVLRLLECLQYVAVINAISACDVRIYALPATPDKVKGLRSKQRGEDTSSKYILNRLRRNKMIKNNPI